MVSASPSMGEADDGEESEPEVGEGEIPSRYPFPSNP